MACYISDLCDKEVISICDGRRLGTVTDAQVDVCEGKVVVLLVSSEPAGIFSRPEEIAIPWKNVKSVGDDIILVDGNDFLKETDTCRCETEPKKKRKSWL